MQREIKFRVWNTFYKEWEQIVSIKLDGTVIDITHCGPQKNCIIQQFTGLKDKNGKEVFEGDIIKYYNLYTGENWTNKIKFISGCFILNGLTLNMFSGSELEIIGNIFNPPCNPDHNGECLNCDNWVSDCEFRK